MRPYLREDTFWIVTTDACPDQREITERASQIVSFCERYHLSNQHHPKRFAEICKPIWEILQLIE
jgi:hypothetical protein